MTERTLRLQPWRYLHEVAHQLGRRGRDVTILSDGAEELGEQMLQGVKVRYLDSVQDLRWRQNRLLKDAVETIAPDAILLHVGLLSFVHQNLEGWGSTPVYGIFTSPLYSLSDFRRAGYEKVFKGRNLSAMHLLGTLMPKEFVRRSMERAKMRCLVTQTNTLCQQLRQEKLWPGPIQVIPPGVDQEWIQATQTTDEGLRASLGFDAADSVVLYYGSPAALRGLHTLIEAFEKARQSDASLKLLILSRRHKNELMQEDGALATMLQQSPQRSHIHIISGYLDSDDLVKHVAAVDIVALPFALVPSDAPLTLLEAQALGKPVITTNLACLPELTANGKHYLAQPGSAASLAEALRKAAYDLRAPALKRSALQSSTVQSPKQDAFVPRPWSQVGIEWSTLLCQ